MQHLVVGELAENPAMPAEQEIAAIRAQLATFAKGPGGSYPKVRAALPRVGDRRTALLLDVRSHGELQETLAGFPLFRASAFEVQPVTTPDAVPGP